MNKEAEFIKWCEENMIRTNPMDMTFYDATYTDHQLYIWCKLAFLAGANLADKLIEDILLGKE